MVSLNAGLFVLAGSQLVPALGFDQAFLAIILGTVIGSIPLALTGFIGAKYGVPTMVATRPVLGIRGSYIPSILNATQLVGWAVFEIVLMANAANSIALNLLGKSNLTFWVFFFATICTLMAVLGPLVVIKKWIEKFAVWTAYGTSIWLLYNTLANGGLYRILTAEAVGSIPFPVAVDLAVAIPISWMPLASDYNRFSKSTREGLLGTCLGCSFSNVLFYSLGVALILFADTTSVVTAITTVVFGVVALALVLASDTTSCFADMYSASVSIQNVASKPPRWLYSIIIGGSSALLALILPIEAYSQFLLWIVSVFVPLFGVVAADHYLVKRNYQVQEFYGRGAYWYFGGLNLRGILAWMLGVVFYYAVILYASWFGASIPTLPFSMFVYLSLSKL